MTSHNLLLLLLVSFIIVLVCIVLLLLFKPKKNVRKHGILKKGQNSVHNKTTPGAWYSPEGDCIFCFVEDVDDYAEYINRSITIHRADEDDRIIGFQIKEINKMMNQESDVDGMSLDLDGMSLDLPIRS